ncbi:hypothetical protein ACOMHN_020211 [Nucella lapillus]
MEDGSAAPMETILTQSTSLGFYQKRLFFCSCFLQALTISALIYASHCRPDLSPTSSGSSTATNGALAARRSKCGLSKLRETPAESLAGNETSSVELRSSGLGYNESDDTLEPQRRSSRSAEFLVSSGRSKGTSVDTPTSRVVSRKVKDGGGRRSLRDAPDVSTTSRTSRDRRGLSTELVTHKHRHRSAKRRDRELRENVASKRTSEDEMTPTPSSLREVVVNTYVEVASPLRHPDTLDVAEYHQDGDDDVEMYDYVLSDDITYPVTGSTTINIGDHVSDFRHSSHSGDETTHHVTSSQSGLGTVILNFDVTSTTAPDNGGCEEKEEERGEEEGGGLHYLSMTYLPAPEWLSREERSEDQLARYQAYCQAVGAMVGATVGAMGADHVGRRRSLYTYFALLLLTHCLSGVSISWTMLAVLRFLVGVFAGACAVVSLVFPLEFIGVEWRDACVCSGMWVAGVIVLSLELLVTRHWRYLAFISGGIGLPLLGTYFIASESARWLLCHQKFPDAESTLKEIISCNSTCVPDFLSLFDKSRTCVVTTMHPKRYTYLDLFHSLEMTKWTLALLYTCVVASSVYFCLLAKVKVMTGNIYLDTSLPFVVDLPLGWSAIVVNRCLGRRWCLFLYAVASGLALVSVLVLHVTGNLTHMSSMLTGMAVFGKIGVTASMGLIFVLAVEMYPTVVRCMGVAVGVVGVAGGFLLSELLVFLETYHHTVPFVVLGAMMSSVGFAGLLFPETLYQPLPNVLPCRHRTIPLYEGVRLVSNPWDVL